MNIDSEKYSIRTWIHPLMLHWIINPGVAFNELILGQRIPKILLIEKTRKIKPLAERSFIPCPHCNTLHSALKWTPQNKTAFGNWFGLYCDHCGQIIPCLTNLTTYLILGLTSPVWYWFRNYLKAVWLKKQQEKFSKPLNMTLPQHSWWYAGLRWGLFMYIWAVILNPLLFRDEITLKKLLIGIPVWISGGLLFGLCMKLFMSLSEKKSTANHALKSTDTE